MTGLPKHLQSQKIIAVGRTKRMSVPTEPTPIQPREKDPALLVGNSIKAQLMQESLDREGYGRQRCFDANAETGSSKKPFTKAEVEAAQTARSIER